ncbi:MAG TPA: TonB-dependent receptor [Thermoanaerobaculia bacterium]|nr:TonB-dependent receptor [Thermoanaerobaculia bacterium]
MKFFSRSLALISLFVLLAATAFGQGTTGSLTGTVTTDGAPLPGATVTVSSPQLQGVRTTVTGDGGGYSFPALPPGKYTVKIELAGMQTVTQQVDLNLAQSARADAALRVSSVSEALTVTAEAPSVLQTPTVSTNFDAKFIENLPIGRTITATTRLAPGVQSTGPNGQTVINGAQSFDNLYLVNGVTVNEQLRGQPNNLFIEDAIQETTVLTSGVSAEYGRFTGGVISTITKSGGNEFSGSFRDNLTNDNWTKKTHFIGQAKPTDKLNSIYEATLGGRVIRDRLWFFGAGRKSKISGTSQTAGPLKIPYQTGDDEKRYEGKLTGNVTAKHSVTGSYLKVDRTFVNNVFQASQSVDLRSLTNQGRPDKLLAIHYNGVLTNNLLIEAQYSKKDLIFVGGGAAATDRIFGTLLRDLATNKRAWTPTFCGVCGDKMRNNKDYLLKGTYFLSTKSLGNHNISSGVDQFTDIRNENNFQSGSNFRLHGDFIYLNAQDVSIHVGDKGYIEFNPLAKLSIGSSFKTESLFVNDKWDLNNHLNFNVGLRYDRNNSKDEEGILRANDSRISPRLGAIFDVKGDGHYRLSANYGRYVAKLDSGIADSASAAGVPGTIYYAYKGPEINAGSGPYLTADQVLTQVFAWFDSVGGTANSSLITYQNIPGFSTRFAGSLKSPFMDEVSVGFGSQFTQNGYFRIDGINRKWGDFYIVNQNLQTGKVTNAIGQSADLGLITNDDKGLSRHYRGGQFQANYRISSGLFNRVTLGGNYTYGVLRGNVEGETPNNATVTIQSRGYYPEYTTFAQFLPVGYLAEDVRHRGNVWAQYDLPTPIGSFNFSVLERAHSGQAFSAFADINQTKVVTNPGYVTPPSRTTYFFSKRGEFRLDPIYTTDLALNYTLPISKLQLFAQAEMLNAGNNSGVESAAFIRGGATTLPGAITSRSTSNLKPFNASTTVPIECPRGAPGATCKAMGANYQLAADFGQPVTKDAFQLARTYRFSVGLRF